MKATILLLVAVFIGAAIASRSTTGLPNDVASGFYPGRSGQIVLKSTAAARTTRNDASVSFVDPTEHQYFSDSQALSSINAHNLADVSLRSVGLAPVSHQFEGASFVKNDYFDRARATVSLLVDAVGDDVVESNGLTNLKKWRSEEPSARLEFQSYPANSLSMSASMSTGVAPSSHGIVGRTWTKRGAPVRAYLDASADAQSPNVADILSASFDFADSNLFEGKPLTLSASSDAQLASAHCAHAIDYKLDNNYCVANAKLLGPIGQEGRTLASELTYSDDELTRAITDPSGSFTRLSNNELTVGASRSGVTLLYNGGEGGLSMTQPEEAAFLKELQYALLVSSSLSSNRKLASLATDEAPDHITFTFASLAPLLERYGRESSQFKAAVQLLDAALPQIMAQISSAYDNRAVYQVVLLGSHESIRSSQDTRAVSSKLSSLLNNANVQNMFPYLYVTVQSPKELASICEKLENEVEGYSVYCPAPDAAHYNEFFALSAHTFQTMSADFYATTVSDEDIQVYQIVLWWTISIIFALIATVYAIMYMDIKRDSLVYGQFNPQWEDRKRK